MNLESSSASAELSFRALFLGVFLTLLLAASNAYLGLFAGMTVSASIPAAVVSMAVLRALKNSSVLESNLVQTAASAGESVAAGAIFTLPALVLMGAWQTFPYWQTVIIVGAGGLLGVVFSVPLRKALVEKQALTFPEGVATAKVLQVGQGEGIGALVWGAGIGAVFKFLQAGANYIPSTVAGAVGKTTTVFFGIALSPALLGVGYIVRLHVASLVFFGGAIGWWIAIPLFGIFSSTPLSCVPLDCAYELWSTKVRYLGVGAMVVGGLWALVEVREHLTGVLRSFRGAQSSGDLPASRLLILGAFMVAVLGVLISNRVDSLAAAIAMTLVLTVGAFLFSAVAGYLAGLVGSSNNPISGMTIATILFCSLLLVAFGEMSAGPQAAIAIGAVVACAAAISGDNLQDLKCGALVGATPWRQQVMQMVGVVSGALVIAPVLNLLHAAYGFGAKTEANPEALAAPQATLMQSVSEGVFGGVLPWALLAIGGAIAAAIILIDQLYCKPKDIARLPVLAVAIGLYLPFELGVGIFVGGLISYFTKERHKESGVLVSSGLITGEALIGIALAAWKIL